MNMKSISKIQANLKRYQIVYSSKTSNNVLDGSYKSVFKGRSMNFDEMREYAPGDDIKDIDWKASARTRKLYVRDYVAEKKHNVMFLFDSNLRMLADSEGMEEKRELAIMSAGTLAYFVEKNGDFVGATFASDKGMKHFPLKTGLANIEQILESYHHSCNENNHSSLNNTLNYIVSNFRRRMIIIIVTDTEGLLSIPDATIRRLQVANDILVINISDVDYKGKNMYSVKDGDYLPDFFTKDKKLINAAANNKQAAYQALNNKFKTFGIPHVNVDFLKEVDWELINLLSNKRKMM